MPVIRHMRVRATIIALALIGISSGLSALFTALWMAPCQASAQTTAAQTKQEPRAISKRYQAFEDALDSINQLDMVMSYFSKHPRQMAEMQNQRSELYAKYRSSLEALVESAGVRYSWEPVKIAGTATEALTINPHGNHRLNIFAAQLKTDVDTRVVFDPVAQKAVFPMARAVFEPETNIAYVDAETFRYRNFEMVDLAVAYHEFRHAYYAASVRRAADFNLHHPTYLVLRVGGDQFFAEEIPTHMKTIEYIVKHDKLQGDNFTVEGKQTADQEMTNLRNYITRGIEASERFLSYKRNIKTQWKMLHGTEYLLASISGDTNVTFYVPQEHRQELEKNKDQYLRARVRDFVVMAKKIQSHLKVVDPKNLRPSTAKRFLESSFRDIDQTFRRKTVNRPMQPCRGAFIHL